MPGINRVHGEVEEGFLLSGYSQTFLKITNAGNVFTADTGGNGTAITEGGLQKAIRAIQTIATTSFIGPRADGGFLVLVDAPTAQPTGPAFDTDSTPTVAERIKAVVDSALSTSTTVVVEPGMLAANVS
jgi:hypothetical protein